MTMTRAEMMEEIKTVLKKMRQSFKSSSSLWEDGMIIEMATVAIIKIIDLYTNRNAREGQGG